MSSDLSAKQCVTHITPTHHCVLLTLRDTHVTNFEPLKLKGYMMIS